MRPAAQLLLIEAKAIRPILETLDRVQFGLPTICTGWSVRDVLGHCGAALTRAATNDLHSFSPADNQHDVESRRSWAIEAVLDELYLGYELAAAAIDRSSGALDGIGLGEWMHGGDVREAVKAPLPYTSEGVDIAFELLLERSSRDRPGIEVSIGQGVRRFGSRGESAGTLTTDLETFVRLCGGRRPDPERYELTGVVEEDLILFS